MATEQDTIMQAIAKAAVEAATSAVQAMTVARKDNKDRMENLIPKIGSLIIQQLMLNSEAGDKYS